MIRVYGILSVKVGLWAHLLLSEEDILFYSLSKRTFDVGEMDPQKLRKYYRRRGMDVWQEIITDDNATRLTTFICLFVVLQRVVT